MLGAIAGAVGGGLLGALTSKKTVGMQGGFDINKNDFMIKDLDKYQGQSQDQYNRATGQQAFVDPKQQAFLNALGQQAAGQGPSLAVEQLKQAQNRNLAQQMAAASAARGGNPALLQRQVMQQAAQNQQQTAAASTQARMQEQMNAQSLYGNQLNNYANTANSGATGAINQGFGMAQAQQQALADYNRIASGQSVNMANINAGIDQNNAQTRADQFRAISGGMQNGSTALQGMNFGGSTPAANPWADFMRKAHGGRVEGEPVSLKDDVKHDTVPHLLSKGEIVVPVSKAQDAKKAKSFIDALFAKEKRS